MVCLHQKCSLGTEVSADVAAAGLGGSEDKFGPTPPKVNHKAHEYETKGKSLCDILDRNRDVKKKIHAATRKAKVNEQGDAS